MEFLTNHPLLLIPVIFLARVFDVSLGTFRAIISFRGYRWLALFIGFFESLVWVLAVSQVIIHLQHWYLVVSYASGFATGTWVGIWLEGRIAIGTELVRVISYGGQGRLAKQLREAGYQPITLDADAGRDERVEVILLTEKRKRIPELIGKIRSGDPDAVMTITDVKRTDDPLPILADGSVGLRGGWRKRGRRK